MLATYLSAVLALLLLWNVFPKDFNYGAAAGNGLLFYNANVRDLFLMPPSSSLMSSTYAFMIPYLQYWIHVSHHHALRDVSLLS